MTVDEVVRWVVLIGMFILAYVQQRHINRQNRQIKELQKRPVGRILSSKLTDEGLMVEGEIWDENTRKRISEGVTTHLSMGPFQPSDPYTIFRPPTRPSDHGDG